LGKLDDPVLDLLKSSPQPLTLTEIAARLGKPEKSVYKALRHLFEKGEIDTKGRQYTVAGK
jgi:DNA-binding IclR family transcriptional regulator